MEKEQLKQFSRDRKKSLRRKQQEVELLKRQEEMANEAEIEEIKAQVKRLRSTMAKSPHHHREHYRYVVLT